MGWCILGVYFISTFYWICPAGVMSPPPPPPTCFNLTLSITHFPLDFICCSQTGDLTGLVLYHYLFTGLFSLLFIGHHLMVHMLLESDRLLYMFLSLTFNCSLFHSLKNLSCWSRTGHFTCFCYLLFYWSFFPLFIQFELLE